MKREWVVALLAAVLQRGSQTMKWDEAIRRAISLLRYCEDASDTAYPSYMDPH